MKFWKEAYRYSTKIWLTSVIASPLLIIGWIYIEEGSGVVEYAISLWFALIIGAVVYSFLAWLVLIALTTGIFLLKVEKLIKRVLIQVVTVVLWHGVFRLLFELDWVFGFLSIPAISYLATLTFGVWVYGLGITEENSKVDESQL